MANRTGAAPRLRTRGSELLVSWRGQRSQAEVAFVLGIDPGAYCGFETGYRRPGLKRAAKIQDRTSGFVPVTSWLEPSTANEIDQHSQAD
jgi:hypothetical protein